MNTRKFLVLPRVGCELASNVPYLRGRATAELDVTIRNSRLVDRFASQYVRIFGVPEIGVQLRVVHVLRSLPIVNSLIDLGCGAGFLFGALERVGRIAQMTGIDIDAESVRIAQAAHPRARCLVADALSYGEDNAYDAAISVDVLEHLAPSDVARFFSNSYRLLKRGGTLVVHVPAEGQQRHLRRFRQWEHHDHKREGLTASELKDCAQNAGFSSTHACSTIGVGASLAWELNMLCAGTPLQAVAFPPLMALAAVADSFPLKRGNGILLVAQREARR